MHQQIGPPVGIDLDPPTPGPRWRPTAAIVGSIGLHVVAPLGVVVVPEAWPWAFGAIAANHLLLGIAGMCPRSTILGPNLTRLPESAAGRREVALTFDDGPDPEVTPKVLDLLDARGVRATFFCIADLAARHPDLCRQIASRGHAIENHSRRHLRTFALLGMRGLRAEIAHAQSILAEAVRNAHKHAGPSKVEVSLAIQDEETLVLDIVNDGVRGKPRQSGMGLKLAALEALQFGGIIEFGERDPGQWRVRLAVPLDRT